MGNLVDTVETVDNSAPAVHELKTWPEHFQAVIEGTKTAEVRKMDRDFKVGDTLYLREYKPPALQSGGVSTRDGHYTGRECLGTITHILTGWGLQDGYAMLSFGPYREIVQPPCKREGE